MNNITSVTSTSSTFNIEMSCEESKTIAERQKNYIDEYVECQKIITKYYNDDISNNNTNKVDIDKVIDTRFFYARNLCFISNKLTPSFITCDGDWYYSVLCIECRNVEQLNVEIMFFTCDECIERHKYEESCSR